jgi:hypothetical protein
MIDMIRYSSIILCFALTLIGLSRSGRDGVLAANKRDAGLQSAALAFALIADYFLMFTNFYAAGILAFQGQHLMAILRYRKPAFLPHLVIAGFASVISAAMLAVGGAYASKALALAAISYGVLLLSAAFYTIRMPLIPRKNRWLSRLGYILFISCDINMALSFMLPAEAAYKAIALDAAWVFYFPAQLLLAGSVFRHK